MVPSQRGCGWLSSRDVYVKTTTRRNTDGTAVRYLHLAHNEWDPTAGRSVPKILHSFGREDHLDRSAITRLVTSVGKLLQGPRGRPRDPAAERVLFALVANRALATPASSPPRTGSPTTSTFPAYPNAPTTPATGPWTGCTR